jgi:hypothetical protein
MRVRRGLQAAFSSARWPDVLQGRYRREADHVGDRGGHRGTERATPRNTSQGAADHPEQERDGVGVAEQGR